MSNYERKPREQKNKPAFEIDTVQIFERPGTSLSEMFYRGYDVSGSDGTIRKFENLLDSVGEQQYSYVTENLLVNTVPDVISMSHKNSGGVYIPNGWNVDRLSFVIKIIVRTSKSLEHHYFIQGYSDYHDPINGMRDGMTIDEVISRNTTFSINGYTRVSVVIDSENRMHPKIDQRISILVTPDGSVRYDDILENENSVEIVRPTDIISDIYLDTAYSNITGAGESTSINTTNRTNGGSTGYLTEIINGSIKGNNVRRSSSIGAGVSKREIEAANLKGIIADLSVPNHVKCPFIYHLYTKHRDISNVDFTLDDLYDMDPDIDHKTTFYSSIDSGRDINLDLNAMEDVTGVRNSILSTNDVSNTDSAHANTRIVLETLHLITSFMMDNNITKTMCLISNDPTRTRQDVCTAFLTDSIIDPIFAGAEAEARLESYLDTIVLKKISKGGEVIVHITGLIDLKGNSSLSIAINGDRYEEVFRFNSSADGRYSPHISDTVGKNSIRDGVGSLLDTLQGV